jgi:hypothetical protein
MRKSGIALFVSFCTSGGAASLADFFTQWFTYGLKLIMGGPFRELAMKRCSILWPNVRRVSVLYMQALRTKSRRHRQKARIAPCSNINSVNTKLRQQLWTNQ